MNALEALLAEADITGLNDLVIAARAERVALCDALHDARVGLDMTVNQFKDNRYMPWLTRANEACERFPQSPPPASE